MAMRPHILGTLMSQITGRPIHHKYTHEDNITLGFHSTKQVYYVTTAVNPSTGAIQAVECTNYNSAGAFGDSAAGPSAAQLRPVQTPQLQGHDQRRLDERREGGTVQGTRSKAGDVRGIHSLRHDSRFARNEPRGLHERPDHVQAGRHGPGSQETGYPRLNSPEF